MPIETIQTPQGEAINFSSHYYLGFSQDGTRVGLMSKTDPNESPLSVPSDAPAHLLLQMLAMAANFGELPATPDKLIGTLMEIKIPA